MNPVLELIERVQLAGGTLTVDGDGVHFVIDEDELPLIDELRVHRDEVLRILQERQTVPAMPTGVRLINWNLKEPPVVLDMASVVTDSALFARTTLEQLQTALRQPKRWVGWSVPQLVDRLKQVGVEIEVK
jgi:hypothetical protein